MTSLALLQVEAGGTPSLVKKKGKVSFASFLDVIGKALAHPMSVAYTYAYLLLLLETVLANIMSENTGYARQQ